jgi:hypothetical protein
MSDSKVNKNNHDIVRNVNGSSGERYANSSSKTESQSWLGNSNSDRESCSRLGCENSADVGAHVINTDGRKSNEWQIAPMCTKDNNTSNTSDMALDKRSTLTPLNPANRQS